MLIIDVLLPESSTGETYFNAGSIIIIINWYEHMPKSVETSQGGKVTILWNQQSN